MGTDMSAGVNGSASIEAARKRGALLKTLLTWHWISSAICLIGLLLFALTGITLNHASQIESKPITINRKAELPQALRQQVQSAAKSKANSKADNKASSVPFALRDWLEHELHIELNAEAGAEWSADELYISLPRPGGDAWVRIALDDGTLEYERTDRGIVALLNDLHKGRHTGVAWNAFIDVYAAGCEIFAATGLLILKLHAANRPSTWPMVALGLVLPLLIVILFIH